MTDPEIIPPPEAKPKRPSEFTDEIFAAICDRMTEGEGLSEICRGTDMPSKTTFLRWVEKDTGRQGQYQRAREALMDHYADEIRMIAWDDSKDTIKDKAGEPKCNHEWINRSRLKVDTLKFLMAKLHPKRYGERLPEMLPTPNGGDANSTRPIFPCFGMVYPIFGPDGRMLTPGSPEHDAVVERAARLAYAEGKKEYTVGFDPKPFLEEAAKAPTEPRQLTFQPDPLPGDLSPEDWSLLTEVLNLIRRTVPTGDNSPPKTIFGILRQALLMHFREVEVDGASRQAAE